MKSSAPLERAVRHELSKVRGSLTTAILIGALLTIGGHSSAARRNHGETPRVAGTVFDHIGAVIVGARISVRGSSFEREALTNEAGEYEIELPPGTYSIEVTGLGFFAARRATFSVREQDKLRFDFMLMVRPTHVPRPMSFEPFELKPNSARPRDVLIEFGKRAETTDAIHYEGFLAELAYYDSASNELQRRKHFFNVIATHARWTVSAKRVTLDKRSLRLNVEEDVRITDGTREIRGARAEIDFSLTNPIVIVKNP